MRGLALAGERQDVALELEVDVLLAEAGQVGREHVVLLGLDQINRRDPAAGRTAVAGGRRVEERREEPVHLLLERVELAHRLPADKCHI